MKPLPRLAPAKTLPGTTITAKIALLVSLVLILCSCASTDRYESAAHGGGTHRQKAVLVEMPMLINDKALAQTFAANLSRSSPESHQAVKDAMENAQQFALAQMKDTLEQQAGLQIEHGEQTMYTVDALKVSDADVAITKEIADRLRAVSGVDLLLRFRVTDYGVTPKAWQNAEITFEVVSTLGIAAVAYAHPATRALAGVYLVQEGIEETAEAYAGFWALDVVCRPVRLEAELVNLDTGTDIWKGSDTGLSDVHLARMLRKVSSAERDAQLSSATHDAAEKISIDLRKALDEYRP